MGLAEKEHIVVHGYIQTANGQDHCFVDDPEVTGFCVYRRSVTTEDGQFDLTDEKDFDIVNGDNVAALTQADTYAKELAGDPPLDIVIE